MERCLLSLILVLPSPILVPPRMSLVGDRMERVRHRMQQGQPSLKVGSPSLQPMLGRLKLGSWGMEAVSVLAVISSSITPKSIYSKRKSGAAAS